MSVRSLYLHFSLFLIGFCLTFPLAAKADFLTQQDADLVLGQADFISDVPSNTATGLNFPRDVAIDPVSGKVFVCDHSNHRVVRYGSTESLMIGEAAEAVFGQLSFGTGTSSLAQNRMDSPAGIDVDKDGRLWVADRSNNRVIWFSNAATAPNGAAADGVLGQPDFVSNGTGTDEFGMHDPSDVEVDDNGTLWVAERLNNRVLRFDNVLAKLNGAAADAVHGQPNLTTVTNGTTDSKMNGPVKLALSPNGTLWVVDGGNRRVLRFDNAASLGSGAAADGVLGQPDFGTSGAGLSEASFNSPVGIALDKEGTLYVGEFSNHRVVYFKNAASKPNGAAADGVLGQPDFVTNDALVTRNGMSAIQGVAVDAKGRLYVCHSSVDRVTRYSPIDGTPKIKVKGKKKTSSSSLTIRGTATSLLDVTRVEYRLGRGRYKKAKGTTRWSARLRRLSPGTNKVTIRAYASDDSRGQTKTRVKRMTVR